MLILTRRVGETLMIGDQVTVTVLGVKGNQVRIGINAPKDLAVHREEIYQRIRKEQEGGNAADAARAAELLLKDIGNAPSSINLQGSYGNTVFYIDSLSVEGY